MSAPVAVVTIARGRHEHLRGQGWGLSRQTRRPDVEVVVAMGDPDVADVARATRPGVLTPGLELCAGELPLAAARNVGARTALAAGAELLVFLDVDCIPGPDTVRRYAEVLTHPATTDGTPVVACGEVAYLPPAGHAAEYRVPHLAELASPHPARPRPAPDRTVTDGNPRLFWSLSFAVTAADWATLGGFCEDYRGYGGEDTDFGQRLRSTGGSLVWVGGAPAYHQHHDSEVPPLRHLTAIVRNANVFRDRWGWFPMEGWLADFANRGLAELDGTTGRWRVVSGAATGGELGSDAGSRDDRAG